MARLKGARAGTRTRLVAGIARTGFVALARTGLMASVARTGLVAGGGAAGLHSRVPSGPLR